MSITVVISAQVSDFDLWKSKFDGLEDQRIAAGINARAYRNPDKPNTSYVIGTAPSKEAFVEFFTSPDRQAIQDSGVITSPPEIIFLEEN
jgi:hypothetical protein